MKTKNIFLVIFLLVIFSFNGCNNPKKEGKLRIVTQEFSIRKDGEMTWTIDAKGVIENIGDVDVKNIEITGFCKSCGEILTSGVWYISSYEKEAHQKDVINYIPFGAQADFNFQEVAYYFGTPPEALPDMLECAVVYFETIQK